MRGGEQARLANTGLSTHGDCWNALITSGPLSMCYKLPLTLCDSSTSFVDTNWASRCTSEWPVGDHNCPPLGDLGQDSSECPGLSCPLPPQIKLFKLP